MAQSDIKHVIADSVNIIDKIHESDILKIDVANEIGKPLLSTLENQSFASIRSGGPSVISTVLHRGMASRHIAVLWSGFNIQSAVNGTFDLGLIGNSFDQSKFYQNGTTALTGNASIAGALSLENLMFKEKYTSFSFSASSTKNLNFAFLNKWRSNKYWHHLAMNFTSDRNHYGYKSGGQKLTQKNASFSMWDINYEGMYLISDKVSLSSGVWLQQANRNIPPTKTSVSIKQEQEDENYRAFVQMAYYVTEESKLNFKSAIFNEIIVYQAPGISSKSNADVYNFSLDYTHVVGLILRLQYRKDVVSASFFEPTYIRNSFGVLADYKISIKSSELGVSIRPEWVDNKAQPLFLSLRYKNQFSNNITTSIHYNRGYTLPSFNDLYWPSGGNPELKTERSHELEFGFNFTGKSAKHRSLNLNLFYNVIDDWIQWMPIDGFFQPVNQRKVRNLGFEVKLSDKYLITEKSNLNVTILYSFTDSRLAKHYLNAENEGKRSVFVPAHKLTGSISYVRNSWQINLIPIYYSKRYDTVDNSSFVSGYFLTDFELFKKINLKNYELNLSLSIENGFNSDYENIRFYAMPLRVFRIGINFKL